MREDLDFNELVDEMVNNLKSGELSKSNSRGGAGDSLYHGSQLQTPLDLSRNQSKVASSKEPLQKALSSPNSNKRTQ